ncbi:unnamed protein product [Caenorhabditis bovis]|uniref:Protein kinase domain-containing protein n=1 Tax=Caenorhabditis bovis TaxID=2654633 RepID=A0A8S1ESE5_9PELO|nr:unnamed protein product [Caenorhabditis bovis]
MSTSRDEQHHDTSYVYASPCPHGAVGEHRSLLRTPRTPQSVPLYSRHSNYSTPPQRQTYRPARAPQQNSYVIPSQTSSIYQRRAESNKENVAPQKPRKPKIEHYKEAFRKKGIEIFIDFKLGNGKYSRVYKAHEIHTNRTVAIKAIDLNELSDDVRKKFLPREISCWRKLKHGNIVAMHAQYETSSMLFLAMEYGNQGDLLRYVQKNGAIEEKTAGVFMRQLIKALCYMHQNGIAHRDVKLENIILFNNCIKLSDFGFVRLMDGNQLSETFCGSKSYSAPELLRGKAYDPFLSDVWSAGVVGFVMVTDSMPFNESLPNNVMVEYQKFRRYTFSPKLNLSRECIESIEAMMTYDVSLRPTSSRCLELPWVAGRV